MQTAHRIGWRPPDFWSSTLVEFFDCIEAHNEAQGETESAGVSQDEVAAAFARLGGG